MKKLFLILMLVVCAAVARPQATTGVHRLNQVLARSLSGVAAQVVPYATVYVSNTATGAAATIYSDPLLTSGSIIVNSTVIADASGNYGYYLPLNYCVTETISSPGQGTQTLTNICQNSGGITPTLLAGAPVSLSGGPGGTSQTLTTTGGPFNPSLSTGSSDNSILLNSWLAAAYPLLIPAGNYSFANPVVLNNISNISITGTGWGQTNGAGANFQTNSNFTSNNGANVGLNIGCTGGGNCNAISLKTFNIACTNTGAWTNITGNGNGGTGLVVNGAPGVVNYLDIDEMGITGCPQAVFFSYLGNVRIGHISSTGSASSAGLFVAQIAGTPLVQAQGSNSFVVAKWLLDGGAHETSPDYALGLLNITNGIGYEITIGDYANANLGVQIGGFETSGGANGAWNVGVSGGSWPGVGSAHITLLNADAYINGPYGVVGQNSVTTFDFHGGHANTGYLGPLFQAAPNGARMTINAYSGAQQTPPPMPVPVQAAGSSAYTSGAQYWFWYQAENTALALPSTTVEMHSGLSPVQAVTIGAAGNTVSFTPPVSAALPPSSGTSFTPPATDSITNSPCFNIWRNTSNSSVGSTEIASCVTAGTSYVSNGSESPVSGGSTTGNIPLAFQGMNSVVTGHCSPLGQALGAAIPYAFMVIDSNGQASNICNAPAIIEPIGASIFQGPQYENLDRYAPAPTTGNGTSHRWAQLTTTVGGVQGESLIDLLNPPYNPPVQVTPQVGTVTPTLNFGTNATMFVDPTDNGATPVTSFTYSSPLGVGNTIFTIQAGPVGLTTNYMEFTTGGSPPILFPSGVTTPVKLYNGCSASFQLFNLSGTGPYFVYLGQPPQCGADTAYPLTITGGVPGGVVYGSSGTQLTVSPAGAANVLMKWGGAGAAPGSSSVSDNGTTVSTAESGSFGGSVAAAAYLTNTNCASAASPAVCGSSAAGAVLIPTGTTSSTLTVNTTAVTANSQIFFYPDDTLGTKLSTTCNSTLATLVGGSAITTRVAGTSFTITFNGSISTNGVCGSYMIIN